MKDMIENELCLSCIYQKNDCKKIEIHKQGTCTIYKCLNYKLNSENIKPYQKFDYIIQSNNEKIKNKNLNKR